MKIRNLRNRIAAVVAASCIFIVALLGVMLYMASERLELALVDQLLTEELNFFVQHRQTDAGYVPRSGPNVQYYAVRTPADEENIPAYARALGPGHYEIDIGEGRGDRDVAVRQVGDTRYIVIFDIGPYEDREREFRQLAALALLAAAALALIIGYYTGGILTRQLRELAEQVGESSSLESSQPMQRDGQDQEVATLAQALDDYRQHLLDMVRREQEFTANASHELRTPLTAIRTSCELLAQDKTLSTPGRGRVQFISQAASHMTGHVEALLYLARGEGLAGRECVMIEDCVNDAAALLLDDIADKGLEFEIAVAPAAALETHREALRIVLINLLRNAAAYTERGFIRIEGDASRLTIADSGQGIAEDKLPHIFERHYRGDQRSESLGLGLHIVKRLCSRFGWTISVRSAPREGSTFVVEFGNK